MKIGIGITTRNRHEVYRYTIKRMAENTLFHHPDVWFFIRTVDDASDVPVEGADFRFEERAGVARAKNKCLELLKKDGCDHIFLFDDDTYPLARGWWRPYVESKEPHLMYQFKLPGKKVTDMMKVYEDGDIIAYSHTRGAMLYIDAKVLDVVGGLDTAYNPDGGFEHPDWTNRIHNRGLTTHRAMDVPGSEELLYCLDQGTLVESSIEKNRKARLENFRRYAANRGSGAYKEYRDE